MSEKKQRHLLAVLKALKGLDLELSPRVYSTALRVRFSGLAALQPCNDRNQPDPTATQPAKIAQAASDRGNGPHDKQPPKQAEVMTR